MKLRTLIAAVALSACACAMAGPTIGFASAPHVMEGGRADPLLLQSNIDDAMVTGIRDAGVELNRSKTTVPAVSLDYFALFQPMLHNLRVLSMTVSLRDVVLVHGKKRIVAVCDWSGMSWRAAADESREVESILKGARDLGAAFAEKCLK